MKEKQAPTFNYVAAATLLIQLFMSVVDGTIVNIALPVLARELSISGSSAVWVVTIYQLSITMLLLSLSSLGEKTGYRRIFITGVAIFTCGSAFCGLSTNFASLLAGRAFQGIGAACIMAVNPALVRLVYPAPILARGLALNAMTVATATAIGPTLAGGILTIASWHWLFWVNVPLGILSFLMAMKTLPNNPPAMPGEQFDKIGAMLNALVFGLVFYAAGSFSRSGQAPLGLCLLIIGGIAGLFYLRRERTRKAPIFPFDLFGKQRFTLAVLTSICSFAAQSLVLVSLPFLFFNSFGFSEMMMGALMTPWPIATIIAAPLAARFAQKHIPGYAAFTGMCVFASGVFLVFFLAPQDVSTIDICWRMAICGLGFGIFQTPNNLTMITSTPMHRSGAAGGMQATGRLTGQTLGAVLVALFFSLVPDGFSAVHICLASAICFAATAGIFSLVNIRNQQG